ncbi:MAG: LAGLIDADG family homing endonuclease [Candidatus Omnitrophota bacterium]
MLQITKARLGGLRRIQLYGNPGTFLGRSKGGKKTTSLFRLNPSYAKAVGFTLRKEIKYPKKSKELAEFMGIMLGDGGLPGNHQLTITFNYRTDREYARYICDILKRLFSVNYFLRKRRKNNGADIVVSSSNLVDFLSEQGLTKGNKIRNQIDVPHWIKRRLEFQIACLRGLMDTDGSIYLHKYCISGRNYQYPKICFTNNSKPLLHFVFGMLKRLNFRPCLSGNNVSIYSKFEVRRYFKEIGTHNLKHKNKFKNYFYNLN